MTYKAHIISHSHWDREWYMPYQKHHLKLINLIDAVLEASEKDMDFDSFHLDGQTICLEDYLEIKPENEERLRKAIKNGKIKIGPWYILQDAFLTSSEANVRNMQVGNELCKRYGAKNKVGYFPDTFGIYGQAAQLMNESEIDNIIFGRGVTPTGFNNQVSDEYSTKSSELLVSSPNGDNVLGILFANWYNNADDIPTDINKAKKYWDSKISDAQKYTKSKNLLFMHGCDHTPYDSTVTEAIKVANQIYDDVEFVHSNFETFLSEIKMELEIENLSEVNGELTNQNTDGYNTLVNTASSRMSQKLMNVNVQDKFEKIVEPLCTMLLPSDMYPHEELLYGWKKILQNHPHDSICGCSVDQVHKGMDLRFDEASDIADALVDNALNYFNENVTIKENENKFTVFNPTSSPNCKLQEFDIVFDRVEIKGDASLCYKEMQTLTDPNFKIYCEGEEVDFIILKNDVKFDYILPNDKFRKAYFERIVKVRLKLDLGKYSWKTYEVVNVDEIEKSILDKKIINDASINNEYYKIEVFDNGTIGLKENSDGEEYRDFIKFVDEGDIGNEYMFGKITNDEYIQWQIIDSYSDNDVLSQKLYVNAQLFIPEKSETSLIQEQKMMIPFNKRKSKRDAENMCIIPIKLKFELQPNNPYIDIDITIDNLAKDHRIRALINPGVEIDNYEVDSIFEVVKRSSKTYEAWKNPSNDQRQAKFLSIPKQSKMFTIANNGLPEYEIVENKYIAFTILRAVGEMGDWGYFPTPDSQCLGVLKSRLTINIHNSKDKTAVYNNLRNHYCQFPMIMLRENECVEPLKLNAQIDLGLNVEGDLCISSYKRNVENEQVLRLFSNGEEGQVSALKTIIRTNLLEEEHLESSKHFKVAPNQIVTLITP